MGGCARREAGGLTFFSSSKSLYAFSATSKAATAGPSTASGGKAMTVMLNTVEMADILAVRKI